MANIENRASPQWRTLYQAALLELDHDKLLLRIAEAKHAIMDRVEDLGRSEGATENEELMNALTALGDLRRVADSDSQAVGVTRKPMVVNGTHNSAVDTVERN